MGIRDNQIKYLKNRAIVQIEKLKQANILSSDEYNALSLKLEQSNSLSELRDFSDTAIEIGYARVLKREFGELSLSKRKAQTQAANEASMESIEIEIESILEDLDSISAESSLVQPQAKDQGQDQDWGYTMEKYDEYEEDQDNSIDYDEYTDESEEDNEYSDEYEDDTEYSDDSDEDDESEDAWGSDEDDDYQYFDEQDQEENDESDEDDEYFDADYLDMTDEAEQDLVSGLFGYDKHTSGADDIHSFVYEDSLFEDGTDEEDEYLDEEEYDTEEEDEYLDEDDLNEEDSDIDEDNLLDEDSIFSDDDQEENDEYLDEDSLIDEDSIFDEDDDSDEYEDLEEIDEDSIFDEDDDSDEYEDLEEIDEDSIFDEDDGSDDGYMDEIDDESDTANNEDEDNDDDQYLDHLFDDEDDIEDTKPVVSKAQQEKKQISEDNLFTRRNNSERNIKTQRMWQILQGQANSALKASKKAKEKIANSLQDKE